MKLTERSNELRMCGIIIAHGDSVISVLSTPEEFDDFVNELRGITVAISQLERERQAESGGE